MIKKNRENYSRCSSVISRKSNDTLLKSKEWIENLLKFRAVSKLYDTYVVGLGKALDYTKTGRVYCDYKLDGAVTGRLSCSMYSAEEPMGVSFHTLPRDKSSKIRDAFVSRHNYSFITCDYSNMELRVLAHLSKDPALIAAFKEDKDLHTYAASLLFQKDESKVKKEERQIAKATSFLIVYGGTAYTLANNNRIPLKRAENIINNYMSVFPGVSKFIDSSYEEIFENKSSTTIFGRVRHLDNVDSKDDKIVKRALRQGLNFKVQSAASDIMVCALLGIYNKINESGSSLTTLATVHDSGEFECSFDDLKHSLILIHDEMLNYNYMKDSFGIVLDVPLKIDVEVGPSFGQGKSVVFKDGLPINCRELIDYTKGFQ